LNMPALRTSDGHLLRFHRRPSTQRPPAAV
jgi:hypothetical protein